MASRPESIAPGTRSPGHERAPQHRVAYVPLNVRVDVRAGETAIGETRDVVLVEENNYPARRYVSRADVDMARLERSDKQTFCPFKGLASYYHVAGIDNAAWSYEQVYAEAELIRGRICFDDAKIDLAVDDE